MYYIAFFFFYAFCELITLGAAFDAFGVLLTLMWLFLMMALGMWMLHPVGLSTVWATLGSQKKENTSWYQHLFPMRYMIAALLVIAPGLLNDLFGLLLLIPFRLPERFSHSSSDKDDSVIDAEFREIHDTQLPHQGQEK